jgi:D-glycero-alpha-D-manno-heptose-7-phosphate kinase
LFAKGFDLHRFADLLNKSWMTKRGLERSVSNSIIDEIYRDGISAGAWGGKLLGAGGGGFFLFICPPERKANVRSALARYVEIPVDLFADGSRIIFNG